MPPMQIKTIEIGLTSRCNLKCPLCTRAKDIFHDKENYPKFKPTELDFNKLKEFIEFIEPTEVKLVGAVGEPTLYTHFMKLMKFLKESNIKVWLSTNGSTYKSDWWYELAQHIPAGSVLNFDIDSPDYDNNTYRRGSNYDKVINNIIALEANVEYQQNFKIRAQRIDFKWNQYNYSGPNSKGKENFIDNLRYRGIKNIELYNIPCYDFNQEEFSEPDLEIKFDHLNLNNYKRLNRWKGRMLESKTMEINIDCDSKHQKLIYLNYVGEVLPCCYLNDVSLKEKELGINIYQNSMEECLDNYYSIINNPTSYTCKYFCSSLARKLYKQFNLDP